MGHTENVAIAAREYLDRRNRRSRPAGSRDRGGRWWPHREEERDCCRKIRRPSIRWPNSLLDHCRTARHVAELYGVPAAQFLRAAREVAVLMELSGSEK